MIVIISGGRVYRRALVALDHGFQKDLHPGRDGRQPVDKIRLERASCHRIIQQLAKLAAHAVGLTFTREQISHPVQGLDG
jgi:hypothetical protein